MTFGVMGILIVYMVSPIFDGLLEKLPAKLCTALAISLILLFAVDVKVSFSDPNTGSGVSKDITEGAWPTTLWRPDHLTINGVEVYNTEEALKAEKAEG